MSAQQQQYRRFQDMLHQAGYQVTVRTTRGGGYRCGVAKLVGM